MKPSGPTKRHTRIKRGPAPKRKGGSRFPKRRDPEFMAWMLARLLEWLPCDAECGRRAKHRSHLYPKGNGGYDRHNVVLLCRTCHGRQEKRTKAFIKERGVDLFAKAKGWTERYDAESAVPA